MAQEGEDAADVMEGETGGEAGDGGAGCFDRKNKDQGKVRQAAEDRLGRQVRSVGRRA